MTEVTHQSEQGSLLLEARKICTQIDGSEEFLEGLRDRGISINIALTALKRGMALASKDAELAAAREQVAKLREVFGGEAAIEAKRLFERMAATPKHTAKRRDLAARHCEASRKAAIARAALQETRE